MTDAEAKLSLLKIVYELETAGLSFASLLVQNHKNPDGLLHPGFVSPLREFKKSK